FFTISFYSFFDIPERTVQSMRDKIQKEWVEDLGVVGRIYICEQGINAQLSIPESNTQALRSWLESSSLFSGRIPKFNWAIEHRRAFKALHVRVRPLVAAGEALDLGTLEHEPEYLKPQDWENELREAQRSQESQPLLIDMRNSYEFRIGKFEGAVCPDVDTFREEMDAVRSMCKGKGKKEPIYMYCTGGIRCSVAGAILKSEGYENVKTLQGGVIAYGRHIREQENGQESSLYHGKNFTFDKRLGEEVTSEVLAKCDQCGGPCDTFTNCANTSCNLLFIQCPDCAAKHDHTCG
ncbi:Rhodanese-like protein, partial [Martensiomyces pterosporus]